MLCMLTLGGVVTPYLAFLIDRDGIGNGTRILSLGGGLVVLGRRTLAMFLDRSDWIWPGMAIPIVILALGATVGGMVYLCTARQLVPVLYGNRLPTRRPRLRKASEIPTNLPLRILPAGLYPVYITQSLLVFIGLMGILLASASAGGWIYGLGTWLVALADPLGYVYWGLLFLGIVWFGVEYTAFLLEEQDIAGNLQQNGGRIPGIRPGPRTHDYLELKFRRLALVGSLVLATLLVVLSNTVYYFIGEDGYYFVLALTFITPAIVDLVKRLEAELAYGALF
jgi:preprotein translocase subunit SecY